MQSGLANDLLIVTRCVAAGTHIKEQRPPRSLTPPVYSNEPVVFFNQALSKELCVKAGCERLLFQLTCIPTLSCG